MKYPSTEIHGVVYGVCLGSEQTPTKQTLLLALWRMLFPPVEMKVKEVAPTAYTK